MSDWVRDSESKPDRYKPVLVVCKPLFNGCKPQYHVAQYDDSGWYYCGSSVRVRDVSFWTLLPDAPFEMEFEKESI